MKLPATLTRDAIAVAAPALRESDLADLEHSGWRRVSSPRALTDLRAWRGSYAAVRFAAESTGQAPEWCCAIDPVRMAADMRDVRLVTWPLHESDASAAQALREAAAALIADDSDARLRRLELVAPVPSRWYLVGSAADALAFDVAAADALVGHALRAHKPRGPDGRLVQRLTTELQMLCHARGGAATGVWPYGAGRPPRAGPVRLPPLASDDPFWRGCWHAAAPGTDVVALPRDGVAAAGSVVAPGPGDMRGFFARIAEAPGLRQLHVAAEAGTWSLRRGGWRGLFARARA